MERQTGQQYEADDSINVLNRGKAMQSDQARIGYEQEKLYGPKNDQSLPRCVNEIERHSNQCTNGAVQKE